MFLQHTVNNTGLVCKEWQRWGHGMGVDVVDMGNGQFALLDGGSAVFADYNSGGFLTANTGLINDWWKFTIQSTAAPDDPDPQQYLAANPDVRAAYGNDTAAALTHYRDLGWAEGRPTELPAATLASGYYSVQGEQGYVWSDGNQFFATHADPQTLRLEAKGNGQYNLRGPGQWLSTDGTVHGSGIDPANEVTYQLLDLGGGQFALTDRGSYVFPDYNAGGFLTGNPGLINDWWKFTIQTVAAPAVADPLRYLAANPDVRAAYGNEPAGGCCTTRSMVGQRGATPIHLRRVWPPATTPCTAIKDMWGGGVTGASSWPQRAVRRSSGWKPSATESTGCAGQASGWAPRRACTNSSIWVVASSLWSTAAPTSWPTIMPAVS
jgi:hypothetical protein